MSDKELVEWATRYPDGTEVQYYPVMGELDYRVEAIRGKPWRLGHGAPVVRFAGKAGGYLLSHIAPMPGEGDES